MFHVSITIEKYDVRKKSHLYQSFPSIACSFGNGVSVSILKLMGSFCGLCVPAPNPLTDSFLW